MRHEQVRCAELLSLALNRFRRVFLEKLAKIAYKLMKIADFMYRGLTTGWVSGLSIISRTSKYSNIP